MAASTVTQPMSKSAKKKAAKAIERTNSPAPSTASGAASADKADDSFESPYIKELQKYIRNINKKIVNATKTDSLLAEHKGKTLDELVAAKILNNDQKAQIIKKPNLQAQLALLEEQLAQYQRVHDQYAAQAAADKAEFEKTILKVKAEVAAEAKQAFEQSFQNDLLLLSQFLRLAAYRREEGRDTESDQAQAIEGVLLAIYSGDSSAVAAMVKLLQGSDEKVISVPGETLESTYSEIGALAKGYTTTGYTETTQTVETGTEDSAPAASTVAEADVAEANVAGIEAGAEALTIIEATPNGLANGNDLSISQEWVNVKAPQDAAAEPAVPVEAQGGRSWADDQPEVSTAAAPGHAQTTDDFHPVQRNRGRHDREGSGNFRGRGRGEYRGRGGRGDGRGRGRGNNRNTNPGGAAPRPPRQEGQ
ncbi:hypothetical protein BBAD15_g10597 [Beauveria bassiana D1-5]|uniref:YAG7-like dimerisation domain-containing protein n=2 Tax=Beauveria bassiana TaxID=176275 RepID=J4KPP8_BEAB2|nr:uncharacterized protein BBA_03609 [Beauveria bassiana ARSEF 2860]EJP67829.1 hypothetical protein BBA_03609 [Beauveria bassiana ARSEF 2860]KAF1733871.1 hypothetical protein CRV24_005402 [Beauveria bassiana]KGQ04144.1 hypothetical protein BBAD15_g10597 [Beauveria bassiana D1-5]